MSDTAKIAVVGLLAAAPVMFVLIVALIRGYTISIHFRRERHRDSEE